MRSVSITVCGDLRGIALTFTLLSALVLGITRVLDPVVDPLLGFSLWPLLLLYPFFPKCDGPL